MMNKLKQKLIKGALKTVQERYAHRGPIESVAAVIGGIVVKDLYHDRVVVFFKDGSYLNLWNFHGENRYEFSRRFSGRWKNRMNNCFLLKDYVLEVESTKPRLRDWDEYSYEDLYKEGLKYV